MQSRRQKSPTAWDKSTSGRSRDARIAAVAGRRLQLICASQLRDLGISRNAIHNAARRGRLHRIHHGVYATHPPPFSRNQRWLAAVLACGPAALLSDEPSAVLQGFVEAAPVTAHVTTPSGRGRSRRGIVIHRGEVDPRDRRVKHGIPCTSADRTLIDLASRYPEPELETTLVAAESLGLLKRNRLSELIAERRGRPGIHKLEGLVAVEPVIARSMQEVTFLPICRLAGLPRPRVNHPIAVPTEAEPLLVDFAWPDLRLIVEADSQRFHGDWEQAERDRERDQALALAGWLCHRFVRRVIAGDPERAAERLRALYEARAAASG